VIEQVVSKQIVDHLQLNGLMPNIQSAYQHHHSTETALLRVMSDIIGSMDNQRVTLLGLLDLSAPFDCVDHEILLSLLEKTFEIRGTAHEWITSFLSGRTQQVYYNCQLSDISRRCPVWCPEGSVEMYRSLAQNFGTCGFSDIRQNSAPAGFCVRSSAIYF
jgi:Reverse transcriptase (RNA-dependent DNA polymerase)